MMKVSPDIHLAFDVGHSSIGWAVLETLIDNHATLLGCGAVIFPADDCLASTRRGFRRQRRHIRATRLRIARMKRLLAHLGVLTQQQLDEPGCAWPWLLAARVLRGGKKLTWSELWDVLRWYAHNRGYDGNKGWSRQGTALDEMDEKELERIANDAALTDDEKKDAKYLKEAKSLMAKHGTKTMAETWCSVCKLDPLGDKKSCNLAGDERPRGLHAAFPRRVIEKEAERILRAHIGVLEKVDDAFITAIMRDYTEIAGPDYRLPSRYGQRLADGSRSPGGLLFGQLVPRFDNRIISRCPLTFQHVHSAALAGTLTEPQQTRRFEAEVKRLARTEPGMSDEQRREMAAQHIAEVAAKVPSADCPEFYRFRWAMQLANVQIATGIGRQTRGLSVEQRKTVHSLMEKQGYLSVGTPKHPGDFMKAVRALTGGAKDNLDQMLALPDADKSLVLDPARKKIASGVLAVLWPHLVTEEERKEMEKNPTLLSKIQRHTLTNLRRGKAVTARALLAKASPAAQAAFDHWFDGEAMKKPRKPRKPGGEEAAPRTRDQALDESHSLKRDSGRAPFTREILREVADFVLSTDRHPADGSDSAEDAKDNGPLFRSEAIRTAQLQRALDEQTNNHLVRHRLRILVGESEEEFKRRKEKSKQPEKEKRLKGLFDDLIDEYAGGDKARIKRITIEVNRDVKEMSGKSAQEQAKEQGAQTKNFRDVEKFLREELENSTFNGRPIQITAGLIRKGRIASDLGWKCPYTGRSFGPMDLVTGEMDKDHIIPRSQRASDSLDSLVITSSRNNKAKDARTGLEFVKWLNQPENLNKRDELGVWTVAHYEAFVKALDWRGHADDERRKKNRKRLMMLGAYIEKEFTPGDLTKTSQLVRLGAQALQRHYLGAEEAPTITSLPGRVTAAVRTSWNLVGCLQAANENVMNRDELDEDGKPKVHRKTEIRGITHLHHALDACVLGFTSIMLPRDGAAWKKEVIELLNRRRCNPQEQAILRVHLGTKISFSQEGQPRLEELSIELREQLRTRLAERRVVQHLPASMSDMVSDQTVWRAFDPADRHPNALRLGKWLAEAGATEKPLREWFAEAEKVSFEKLKTAIIVTRKRKAAPAAGGAEAKVSGKVFHEGKTWRWVYDIKAKDGLLGFAPTGDPAKWKLKPYKAVKVLGDNFGLALDPEPTLIRSLHVWRQVKALRTLNGRKMPRIVRKGTLIQATVLQHEGIGRPKKNAKPKEHPGIYRVASIKNQATGEVEFDLCHPDSGALAFTNRAFPREIRDLVIVRHNLCGIAAPPVKREAIPGNKSAP